MEEQQLITIDARTVRMQPDLALHEYLKKIHRLPEPLRMTFFAEETWSALAEVTAGHNLETQQCAVIAETTAKILTGEFNPNFLVSHISSQFGMARENARAIALDISKRVFAPVRNELAALYGLARPQGQPEPAVDRGLTRIDERSLP